MKIQELRAKRRLRRKRHIRKIVFGSAERLRLTIFRSNLHIYAQIINDEDKRTIVSASTVDKEVREKITPEMTRINQSELVGQLIAQRAVTANIKSVAFDRNGYIYHGRVKALADSARKHGLEF